MEGIREGQTDVREQADKISTEIDAVQEKINKCFSDKDEVRDVYWKGRYDFDLQRDLINHIQEMQERKDTLKEFESEKTDQDKQR